MKQTSTPLTNIPSLNYKGSMSWQSKPQGRAGVQWKGRESEPVIYLPRRRGKEKPLKLKAQRKVRVKRGASSGAFVSGLDREAIKAEGLRSGL